jgi:hypothetical protein
MTSAGVRGSWEPNTGAYSPIALYTRVNAQRIAISPRHVGRNVNIAENLLQVDGHDVSRLRPFVVTYLILLFNVTVSQRTGQSL